MTVLRTFSARLLPLAWALVIAWLSLVPSPPSPDLGVLALDKVQHAAAYFVLCLLIGQFVGGKGRHARGAWIRAWWMTVLFGGLLEIAQDALTVSRTAEIGDLAADSVGAFLAVLVARCYQRWRRGNVPVW